MGIGPPHRPLQHRVQPTQRAARATTSRRHTTGSVPVRLTNTSSASTGTGVLGSGTGTAGRVQRRPR